MRHGVILARRVTPATWARASRLSHTPRQCFSRPCVSILAVSGQWRLNHSTSASDGLQSSAHDEQSAESSSNEEPRGKEDTQATTVDTEKEASLEKPEKDHEWVFGLTGERIGALKGVGTDGTEEFVAHESGTKLLCSWSISHSGEPTVWVPGDAPRVGDMKVPVDLEPEATAPEGATNSGWSMGSPQASFEPFFASLAAMNPRAKFDSTDVIARSNVLQLLMGVARGGFNPFGKASMAAAFHVALVGNTLLIKKMTNPTRGNLGRGMSPTVNGSFMNKITQMKRYEEEVTPDHYHAVRYDIGPLSCVAIIPVEAATGHASLPPVTFDEKSLSIPKTPDSPNVRPGGRGVIPIAAAKITTALLKPDTKETRVNGRGFVKMKPASMAKIWLERPTAIVQGHLEAAPPEGSEGAYRLHRISVRPVKPILNQIEDIWQLEFRRLVTLLDHLRDTAKKAGGSCMVTYQPPQKATVDKPDGVEAKFELFKVRQEAVEPIILDWHMERFWSKR